VYNLDEIWLSNIIENTFGLATID